MRSWIRDWLGLTTMQRQMTNIHNDIIDLKDDIVLPLGDIASVLRDEHDPARKKLSDRLGEKVRQRLVAEDMARKHTTGEL